MNKNDIIACAECGHLHWTGSEYIECPIRDCICQTLRAMAAKAARTGLVATREDDDVVSYDRPKRTGGLKP